MPNLLCSVVSSPLLSSSLLFTHRDSHIVPSVRLHQYDIHDTLKSLSFPLLVAPILSWLSTVLPLIAIAQGRSHPFLSLVMLVSPSLTVSQHRALLLHCILLFLTLFYSVILVSSYLAVVPFGVLSCSFFSFASEKLVRLSEVRTYTWFYQSAACA